MADVFKTVKVTQTPGGPLQQQLVGAVSASSGVADAGKIIITDASGQLDGSFGGGGGGTSLSVNGSPVSSPNLQGGGTVTWTVSVSNITANVIALPTTGSPVVLTAAAPPSVGQVLTATSATAANWQTPGGSSLAAGIPIVTGATISASDNSWPGYTVWQWLRGSVLVQQPTKFKIQASFTAGTGVHIANCVILRTAPWSGTVIDSTPVTFNGGSPTPLNVPFGTTATTTAPFFLMSDTINLAIDSNHDYYVAWFFDNDGVFNGSVGFNEWTPTSASCGCPFLGFYQSGADQTGVSPIPTFPFSNGHVVDLLYAVYSA